MLDRIVYWVRVDSSELSWTRFSRTHKAEDLAVPTMLLHLVDQLQEEDEEMSKKYAELEDWGVQRILKHLQVGTVGTERGTPTLQGALNLKYVL